MYGRLLPDGAVRKWLAVWPLLYLRVWIDLQMHANG